MDVPKEYFIVCSDVSNSNHMKNILEGLCHLDFKLDHVIAKQEQNVFDGKCIWSAFYKLKDCNKNDLRVKANFEEAIKNVTKSLPIGSHVVSYGRYGGFKHGVFVDLGNNYCGCKKDFDSVAFQPRQNIKFDVERHKVKDVVFTEIELIQNRKIK